MADPAQQRPRLTAGRRKERLRRLAALVGVLCPCLASALAAQSRGIWFRETDYLVFGDSGGVGDSPYGVVVADFNGDGKVDLATATNQTNNVTILLGRGDGSFGPLTARSFFATGMTPRWIVAGDFNGDGKVDLATANWEAGTISVLLGNGDGTFGANTDFTTGAYPDGICTGDFNRDGIPDLVTTNQFADDISVLLGQGGGLFASHVDFPSAPTPVQCVVGDFNGDGKDDIAVATMGGAVSILLGRGDGTFAAHTDFLPGRGLSSLATGDFNADGVLDLVTANYVDGSASILLGRGDGTFNPKIDLPTAAHPLQVIAADFNGDGKLDFLTASERGGACILCGGPLTLYLGNGDGTFGNQLGVGSGPYPTGLAAADFNADGRMDLAVADAPDDAVGILLQSTPPDTSGTVDFTLTAACRGGNPPCSSDTVAAITAGQSISFNIIGTPIITGTPSIPLASVTLACGNLPPEASCTFTPGDTLDLSAGPQSVTLTIRTLAPSAALVQPFGARTSWPGYAFVVGMQVIALLGLRPAGRHRKDQRRAGFLPLLALVLAISSLLVACNESSVAPRPGTPRGTDTVVVAATAGSLRHTLNITVVIQ